MSDPPAAASIAPPTRCSLSLICLSPYAASAAPDADGVFLPCARWPTLDALPLLEQELGLPVVSSTVSVFYGALQRLGVRDGLQGFGSLLASLTPRPVSLSGAARLDGVPQVQRR